MLRAPAIDFKLSAQGSGVIEGYGSTFGGPPDYYGHTIAEGAFRKSLRDLAADGRQVSMLWMHDQHNPIGRWLSVEEDQIGLKVVGQLSMAIQQARDAFELAKDGALGLSIGFNVVKDDRTAAGRLLTEIELWECSLVAIPANARAVITRVKSAADAITPDQIREPRAFETYLRDAGFSRSFAKAIVAGGFKSAIGRRDGDDARHTLSAAIKAAILSAKE